MTISEAKLQLCQAEIRLMKFICDVNGCYSDTPKGLNILD